MQTTDTQTVPGSSAAIQIDTERQHIDWGPSGNIMATAISHSGQFIGKALALIFVVVKTVVLVSVKFMWYVTCAMLKMIGVHIMTLKISAVQLYKLGSYLSNNPKLFVILMSLLVLPCAYILIKYDTIETKIKSVIMNTPYLLLILFLYAVMFVILIWKFRLWLTSCMHTKLYIVSYRLAMCTLYI